MLPPGKLDSLAGPGWLENKARQAILVRLPGQVTAGYCFGGCGVGLVESVVPVVPVPVVPLGGLVVPVVAPLALPVVAGAPVDGCWTAFMNSCGFWFTAV